MSKKKSRRKVRFPSGTEVAVLLPFFKALSSLFPFSLKDLRFLRRRGVLVRAWPAGCTCSRGSRPPARTSGHSDPHDGPARAEGRKERVRSVRPPRSFSLLAKGIGVRCQRPARLLALTLAAEDVRSRSRSSAPRPLPPPDGGEGGSKEKKPPSANALGFDLTRGEPGDGYWDGLGLNALSLPPSASAPIDVVGVGVAKPPPAPAQSHLTEIGRRAACLR